MVKNYLWKHRIAPTFGCLFLTIIVGGCSLTFIGHANERMQKLDSLVDTLPVLVDSVLIKKEENIVRSHVPKCARVQILQLYGTNTMTFQGVINHYESQLDKNVWQIERTDESGVSFVGSDKIQLGVSSDVNWPLSLIEDLKNQQKKFKFLFIVALGGFVDPKVNIGECT